MPLKGVSKPLGIPFIELQSIDSTNKYAMARIHEGLASNGMAVLALEQTDGRGQRGKTWVSAPNVNLTFSIVVDPYPLNVTAIFHLSVCTAISVFEVFSKYAGDETRIKWPNDIYWRDRKAGGLLIENVIRGRSGTIKELNRESNNDDNPQWKWAVIGIGLNINQTAFSKDLPNPVSLKQITGKDHNITVLAKEICNVLGKYFDELKNGKFPDIFSIYLSNLYKKDQIVSLKKEDKKFNALIKGVSESGQLITDQGVFEFGEVVWEGGGAAA